MKPPNTHLPFIAVREHFLDHDPVAQMVPLPVVTDRRWCSEFRLFGTPAARDPQTIAWANGRSNFGIVPDFVKEEWEIDLGYKNDAD